MNYKNLIIIILFICIPIILTSSFASQVSAAEINVNGNRFSDIQNSINSANSNDVIKLENKTYSTNGNHIEISGKTGLLVQGESSSRYATLDGKHLNRIFFVESGSSVTFKYINFINGNSSTATGAAIRARGQIHVDSSTFSNNLGESGAAIFLFDTASGSTIKNSQFTANKGIYPASDNWIEGGAIDCQASSVSINNCHFKDNTAQNAAGALSFARNIVGCTVTDSTFTNNKAIYGGAIRSFSSITIDRCLFTGNSANSGSTIHSESNLHIKSTTFSNNKANTNIAISLPYGIRYYLTGVITDKKYSSTVVQILLTKNDNVADAIWQTSSGSTYINNVKQTPNDRYSGQSITLNGKYSGKTNSNGIAQINFAENTLTGFKGLTKTSGAYSYKFSVTYAGNNLYQKSSSSLSASAKVSNNQVNSYWNLMTKKNGKVKKNITYKVNKKGWYKKVNGKWKTTSRPKTSKSDKWYKQNSKTKKYKPSKAFTKNKSKKAIKYKITVTRNGQVNNGLKPYVKSNLEVTTTVNKKSSKYTQKGIYIGSTDEIYFINNEYDKKLNDKINSKDSRIQVNESSMRNVVIRACRTINGKITGNAKMEAIYSWQHKNVKYQRYSNSHFKATDVHWRMNNKPKYKHANCVDQSILLVTLLRTAGVPSYFINSNNCYYPSAGKNIGHVYVKVYVNNIKQKILDTTSSRNKEPGQHLSWTGGSGTSLIKNVFYFYDCKRDNWNHHSS